jgi:hypothetical protein
MLCILGDRLDNTPLPFSPLHRRSLQPPFGIAIHGERRRSDSRPFPSLHL